MACLKIVAAELKDPDNDVVLLNSDHISQVFHNVDAQGERRFIIHMLEGGTVQFHARDDAAMLEKIEVAMT